MSKIKRVVLVQPASAGGNFEYMAIPRQGMLMLSAALGQWEDGPYLYEREIWFEDRSGLLDPDQDLEGVDVLLVTALINEAPRAYQIARLAKEYHPELVTIGGGPQMGPLAEEAFRYGNLDVIVQREGEDIIGQLCDLLLTHRGSERNAYLEKMPGISYREEGQVVQTRRQGLVSPDFVELPDFRSIKDLGPYNPMPGGVIETVRGCTENCSYCQVIQQFLGYRLIDRETELKRLHQLEELASDGLIHTTRNGKINVFISDDLHTPPLRAVKYRDERLARLKNWQG
ncbi:MAG: B12-binding domain-containing radical SAM protein, partial [Dehalococcoidia bacterium]